MTLDGFHRPRLVADPRIASRPRRKVSRSGGVAVRGPFRQRSAHRRANTIPRPSARPPSDRAAPARPTTRGTLPGAAVRSRPSSRRRARARAGTCRRARRVAAATWPQNWGVRRAARRPRRGVGRRRNRRPRRGADFATPRKPTKSARDDEMGRRRPRSGAGLDVGTGAGSGRGAAAPQTACPGVNVDLSRRAAARRRLDKVCPDSVR